ncbi:MAG: SUMF1/EgtB/PvdO family nonheme iron enzyme [Acidobacteriia bacterium]|nr:SUMF1/EgtB/PvdO family nonheme iron enzyme [Terriglobia bacterium]
MPCWIAPRDIPPSADYPTAIVEGIRSIRVLVLLLTEHAAASPHVLSEVGHAFNGKKRIIPFRLSVAPMPEDLEYFLSLTQWLDAPEGCTDGNLKRLTDATRVALAGDKNVHGTGPAKQKARWLTVAIAVLVVIAGAFVAWRWHRASVGKATSSAGVTATSSTPGNGVVPETPQAGAKPKPWVNPADSQTYVWIPPGEFNMGCSESDSECTDDEKPTHPVSIDRGFWLGQTEVTLSAYRKYAGGHGATAPGGAGDMPATEVSWAEAKTYCAAVGGRLPTEAEWEYAARGGRPGAYYGVVPEIAWYAGNSGDAPHPVGKKKPNAYGLYDVLGNVREWVLDRYYNKYDVAAPATGDGVEQPLAPNASTVARGGFWESEAAAIRVSHRSALETNTADPSVGWRCASDHR